MIRVIGYLVRQYNDQVWMAAQYIDGCKDIISEVSSQWENGESFVHTISAAALFGRQEKREGDTIEEIAACAQYLHGRLQSAIGKHWVASISRDQAVAVCNLLYMDIAAEPANYDAVMGYYNFGARYEIVSGVSVTRPEQLMEEWNRAHSDQPPITRQFRRSVGDDSCRLTSARRSTGMSQQQLAEQSGVNARQIRRVESGESTAGNLTARNLLALADALGVDPHDLI